MIIRNQLTKDQAIEQVRGLQLDTEWEMVIKEFRHDRTTHQNNLLWLWHTEFAKQYGDTKERVHSRFKYKYVLPVMLRRVPLNAEDRRLQAQLRELYDLATSNKNAMAALVRVISTAHLTTKEMSEALDEYDRESSANGIIFPHPDLYGLAVK